LYYLVVDRLQHPLSKSDELPLIAVKGEDHPNEHAGLPGHEFPLPPVVEKNDSTQSGNKKKTDLADAAKQMSDYGIPPESQARLKTVCKPISYLHNRNSHEVQRIILGRTNVSRSRHQLLVEGAPIPDDYLRTCHLRGDRAPK
jgi:hypothetical protein